MIKQSNTSGGRGKAPQKSKAGARRQSKQMERVKNPLFKILLEETADVYSSEQQLIKFLPRLAKAAQSRELRQAFEKHLKETVQQAKRIEKAVKQMGESLRRKTCKGMEGILAEAGEVLEEHKGEPVIDAVLICAAQKVEHYEIAAYGCVCAWLEQLGHDDVLELFSQSLDEEKAADEKLTELAESMANVEAQGEE